MVVAGGGGGSTGRVEGSGGFGFGLALLGFEGFGEDREEPLGSGMRGGREAIRTGVLVIVNTIAKVRKG